LLQLDAPTLLPANASGGFLRRVLAAVEDAGVTYCVLRGGVPLEQQGTEDEIDVLVSPAHLPALRTLLAEMGFVRLRTWGHAPHHFFVAYEPAEDRWLKLDVVTAIAYGRPTHPYATNLADACLRNRRRVGGAYIPAAADELATLALHCLVDKGDFPEGWRERLSALCEEELDEKRLTSHLTSCWSPMMTGPALRSLIAEGKWEQLLSWRAEVMQHLASRGRLAIRCRRMRDRLLRKLNRAVRFVRPDALSVAVLAPDGAGKSTLSEGVARRFFFPVEQIYMGLYQQKGGTAKRGIPGCGLAGNLLKQWGRFLRAHFLKARGRFVIFDRYTYDAYLPGRRRLGPLQRFRRWLLAHACPAPNLILMLDAPGEVLFARKGEHSADFLEEHRQAYLNLRKRFPQMIVVDATRDADQVRRSVMSHIWHGYAARLREVRHGGHLPCPFNNVNARTVR
jgi:hypothetical protein